MTRTTKEIKYYDSFVNGQPVTATGTVAAFFTPVQGTDIFNRVGRKVVTESIWIRLYYIATPLLTFPTNVLTGQMFRMVLLIDRQSNGTLATPAMILEQVYTWSALNYDNRDRFRVLADYECAVDPYVYNPAATTSQNSTSGQVGVWKRFKRIRESVIFNAGNAGSYADINTGTLLILMMNTNTAPSGVTAYYNIRTRFHDD